MRKIELLLVALLTVAAPAWAGLREDEAAPAASPAATPAPPPEARIVFADKGGIWNWEVLDSTTILIQDRGRRWYKAKLLASCTGLPFEQRIGFESNADGSFDKFSAIQTRQQRCPLVSLVRSDAPPKKSKKKDESASKAAPATMPEARDISR
jgi:Family of unknown function (DUF6491)